MELSTFGEAGEATIHDFIMTSIDNSTHFSFTIFAAISKVLIGSANFIKLKPWNQHGFIQNLVRSTVTDHMKSIVCTT